MKSVYTINKLCLSIFILITFISFSGFLTTYDDTINIISSSSSEIFPESWLTEDINAKAVAICDENEFNRAKRNLHIALRKYPKNVLRENLKTIYVIKKLSYSGITAGGTNSLTNVYIANNGKEKGYTDKWIEKSFHHEFSSILIRNFHKDLNSVAWGKINDSNFKYGTGGVKEVKETELSKLHDRSTESEGFLYEYAKSSLENDFNSFAEALFLGKKEFWLSIGKHEKLKKKAALAILFYSKIHPDLNLEYFMGLVK